MQRKNNWECMTLSFGQLKDPEAGNTGAAVAVHRHRWGMCRRTSNSLSVFTVEM